MERSAEQAVRHAMVHDQHMACRGCAKTHHPTDEVALKQLTASHPLPALILEYRCMHNFLTKWVEPSWVQQAAAASAGPPRHLCPPCLVHIWNVMYQHTHPDVAACMRSSCDNVTRQGTKQTVWPRRWAPKASALQLESDCHCYWPPLLFFTQSAGLPREVFYQLQLYSCRVQ